MYDRAGWCALQPFALGPLNFQPHSLRPVASGLAGTPGHFWCHRLLKRTEAGDTNLAVSNKLHWATMSTLQGLLGLLARWYPLGAGVGDAMCLLMGCAINAFSGLRRQAQTRSTFGFVLKSISLPLPLGFYHGRGQIRAQMANRLILIISRTKGTFPFPMLLGSGFSKFITPLQKVAFVCSSP